MLKGFSSISPEEGGRYFLSFQLSCKIDGFAEVRESDIVTEVEEKKNGEMKRMLLAYTASINAANSRLTESVGQFCYEFCRMEGPACLTCFITVKI